MEQLTKNQAVATSQEAVQNQNEPQLRDENAHNDKSVHGVLNPTYQAGLRRDAVQPDIEAERKKREIGRAVQQECRDRYRMPSTVIYTLSLHDALPILTNLSTECLIQLTKLGYDATPFNQILKQNAKREMRLRLGKVTVADVLAAQPVTT